MHTLLTRVILAAVAALAVATPAVAWGPAGHEAVAQVAWGRLSPAIQMEVSRLLAGRSMPAVSVWADDVRNSTHQHTNAWHFTNIPLTQGGFSRTRDCQRGDCVVAAIERLERTLGDRTRPRTERQEALQFLIHFIADVHQPLHAADSGDRGGGQRNIAPVGGSTNLHFAWDSGIIQAQRGTAASLATAANAWLTTQTEATLASGSAADWANESHRIARDIVYPQLKGDNAIVGAERQEALRIIEKRIARAGVRLAAMLNRVLAPPPSP